MATFGAMPEELPPPAPCETRRPWLVRTAGRFDAPLVAAALTMTACGAPTGGSEAQGPAGAADCGTRVLTLPREPVVIDMRGALRCRRDHVFEDEREHRVDEEVIDHGPLSCVSGCPEGYEAEWFPQRLTLTPDGSLFLGSPHGSRDANAAGPLGEEGSTGGTPVGRLDPGGCFRTSPGAPIVRWDGEGRLLSPQLDAPLPVRVRDGRLEILVQDRVEHVMTVRGGEILVNGVSCGTITGPSGVETGSLGLRMLPLGDFAGLGAER